MTDNGLTTPPPRQSTVFAGIETVFSENSENMEINIYSDEIREDDDVNPLERSLIKSILGKSDRSINGYEIAGEGMRSSEKKGVSFNIAPGSTDSSVADIDKSKEELYAKLDKVEMKLKQAEIDLTAEKTLKKKKERNLIKLAKELNKRASEQEIRDAEIAKLNEEVATYEAKLAATRKELDERVSANEEKNRKATTELDEAQKKFREAAAVHDSILAELTKAHTLQMDTLRSEMKSSRQDNESLKSQIALIHKDFEEKTIAADQASREQRAELAASQQKYREAVELHDTRMSEQSSGHAKQTEELRRQILAANLEADKLRTQLASVEMMDATPEEAAKIVERTMRASFAKPKLEEPPKPTSLMHHFLKLAIFVVVGLLAIGYHMQLLSMDSICSPALPGMRLEKADETLKAPWWVPAPNKDKAFELVCGSRLQTSLNWHAGRLTISNMGGKVLLERKAPAAVVHGNIISFVDKKGKVENLQTPWSR